ncbi:MAG TPA: NADH-quinone oxidoreductase subunit N [Acidimicrobiales bacterium]|nr:NADH-quinone oxidoreductase subunit N [Acidimicrobiales bacterium]
MAGVVAAAFEAPHLDYAALAPEMVLTGVLLAVLVVDLFVDEDRKAVVAQLAGVGLLASLLPIVFLAVDGDDRSMFSGAYVVDDFALVLKALFLVSGYVVLLMSADHIEEGDYWKGEYTFLLLSSLLGMVVMCSSRDLLTIFVALELLSIPAYMLAGWRKRDLRSNEAALKYYLLGVLSSAVMLYGMSLVFGATGTTVLEDIARELGGNASEPLVALGIFFIVVGFAFKVSAVPFHFWAPDTYEGAPTPVTAFLSVASKAAGFVALLQLVFVGFFGQDNVWQPLFWVLAALTMTVGNLVALRQTNIVRLLAYSSVAQAGYMLVPFAVGGSNDDVARTAQTAAIVYLLIYAAMNLGAFAVVIAVARKTRSGEVSSYGGLFTYAPGLTVLMTVFLFSLAGIPPFGGWFAKLYIFKSAVDAGTGWSIALAVIAGVNSVIALFYYASVAREMWMRPVPDDDVTPVRVPPALGAALAITALAVVAIGVYPQAFARLGDLAELAVR